MVRRVPGKENVPRRRRKSITRCAMSMPAPVMLVRLLTSLTSLTGPPECPCARKFRCLASASAISPSAQRAGSSGLWRQTSAMPSPVGNLVELLRATDPRTLRGPEHDRGQLADATTFCGGDQELGVMTLSMKRSCPISNLSSGE